jgi:hypothetical protein
LIIALIAAGLMALVAAACVVLVLVVVHIITEK